MPSSEAWVYPINDLWQQIWWSAKVWKNCLLKLVSILGVSIFVIDQNCYIATMFDSNSIKIEKILFSNCLKHRHRINGLVMLGLVPRLDYYIFVAA